MTLDQEREAFEAWFKRRYDYDDLDSFEINMACEAWQAALASPEVQELQKDAERYRWLRVDTATSAIPRVWLSNESADPLFCLHGQNLDDAIDAALKEQP